MSVSPRLGWLLALGLGPVLALGQAPWGLWGASVLALAGVALLVVQASGAREAAARAWMAGAAQFAVALHWLVEPFLVDATSTGWMAPFAVVLMSGGLALFWAAAGWASVMLARGVPGRLAVFVLAMLAAEALRGWLFTGFPWAMLGHVWIGTPADQIAALGGALSLSALSLGIAVALAGAAFRGVSRGGGLLLALALVLPTLAWAWGAARLAQPEPPAPDITLRLVQANVPQEDKWRADLVEAFFLRHLDLTAAPSIPPPDLVIWSETAAPFFLDRPGDGLVMATEAAGVPLVMGVQRRHRGEDGSLRYFNSLAVLDAAGFVQAVYDKHHLVPFGEYIPLIGAFAQSQGWSGLAARMLSGYTPGPGPALLDLGPAGIALPLICYEAVFPRNLRSARRPDWIVQSTNDAWFGGFSGPYQHLAQAQLRAIETGLPLVRAANTGVSAVVDARGRLTASLGLDQTGVLDAPLPGARAATPYARTGDTPWLVVLVLGLLALTGRRLRQRKAIDAPGTRR